MKRKKTNQAFVQTVWRICSHDNLHVYVNLHVHELIFRQATTTGMAMNAGHKK